MLNRFDRAASRPGKGNVPASMFLCFILPFLLWANSVGAEDGSYNEGQGPGQWKGFCRGGHQESPVNITDIKHFDQSHLAAALLHLEPTHFHAEHIHHIVLLEADEGSILIYEGKTYELSQAHWHTPSEHKVRGQAFDMEMHWVFLPNKTIREVQGDEEDFTAVVIAVFMQVTEGTQGLSVFDTVLTHIPPPEDETDIKRWLLLPRLVPITQNELDLYVQYAGAQSARPVQPLYEREKEGPLPLQGINLPFRQPETPR